MDGWKRLHELKGGDYIAYTGKVAISKRKIPPSLRSGIGVWTTMMRNQLIEPIDQCYMCGKELARDYLQLDHVIPVHQDLKKALDEENLLPACKPCHRKKTDGEQVPMTGKTKLGTRWTKLIRTPEQCGEEMTYDIEVDGPNHNFVADGLVVHNSYNEMSARYAPLPNDNYIPTVERLMLNSKDGNKQAGAVKGSLLLTEENAKQFQESLQRTYDRFEYSYKASLDCGVPKELARCGMPVGRYSQMRASTNLRNWLGFLTLRMSPHAQWEIRKFANAVAKIIEQEFPRTYSLFAENKDG